MTRQVTNEPPRQDDPTPTPPPESPAGQLVLGLVFGVIFGFLLQRGGVGKYEVLIGMLLLKDFTVLKVILSAVLVGMIGIYTLHARGLVQLHIKPTRYGANTIGGVIFGIGFALAAYCPGTSAVAFGQGNYDALAVMLGMMIGSYVFAEASGWIDRIINRWGSRGELTFDQLLGIRKAVAVPTAAILVLLILLAVHFLVDPTP
ncbi:MAG: YeeE/YedE thiosulfate transporter family protein [Planctomycetota bacterium]